MEELDEVGWDPWELSCVLQPGHYKCTGICVSSFMFLRANNALSRGSGKDKLTEAFASGCGRPIKFCALHIWLIYLLFLLSTLMNIYNISNYHIYSGMTQLFFVSLMPWGRCYWSICQATVFDVQNPKVQGKVWYLEGFMESLFHPSCCLLPHSLLLHVTRFSYHGNSLRDYTLTRHLRSWKINN